MSQLALATINDEQRRAVAILLAQLVREGVQFSAVSTDCGNDILINFTGGF
mgnify:FL=1|tara:strand:+ start:323 stop:475 length:153 start_codon:yes stop_codon:yes gene_type:complete